MKIVSKFKDYYDSMMKNGVDTSVIYKRVTEEKNAGFLPVMEWHKENKDFRAELQCVIFCGKMYPMIKWSRVKPKDYPVDEPFDSAYGPGHCHQYQHGLEACSSAMDLLMVDNKKWKLRIFNELVEYMRRDYVALHIEHQSPVLYCYHDRYNNTKLIVDPKLETLRFGAVKSPMDAFQEIYVYLSVIKLKKDPEPRPISDKIKILAHGMDPITSFRKETHQRKGKKK